MLAYVIIIGIIWASRWKHHQDCLERRLTSWQEKREI